MSIRPRGPLTGWEPRTPRQAGILADLKARYAQHEREDTWPRGGRGIFYDLRPRGMGNGMTYRKVAKGYPKTAFDPMEAHPDLVQEVLLLARRAGLVPEHLVADAHAPEPLGGLYYASGDDYLQAVAEGAQQFELDPQQDQPVHVEVTSEAEDLAPRLDRVARPYGVRIYPSGGYGGLKGKRALADRADSRDVPTVVLHVGDYDVHGSRIFTALAEDAAAWCQRPGRLQVRHLALTAAQAHENNLLDEDGHAEVDGLPVPVMDAILTDALGELLDPATRERVREHQREERERVIEALRRLR
jgi:hypothetical protein